MKFDADFIPTSTGFSQQQLHDAREPIGECNAALF